MIRLQRQSFGLGLGLTLLCLSLSTGRAQQPDQQQYFSVKINDKLLGYALINARTTTKNGRAVRRVESLTALKLAMLGKERTIRLESVTIFSPANQPLSYRLTSTTNEVVQLVETEFAPGLAKTWIYRQGDARGEAKETKLPEDAVILGSNNFAHWADLLAAASARAVDGSATIPVFLPDAAQITPFELVRGDAKKLPVAGAERTCVPWRVEAGDLVAWADATTNGLVRLDLPGQNTVIELAEAGIVKLAEKSRAEEVLAEHFSQSNVVFDDFLKVTELTAEIDVRVIGEGVDNDNSILTTSMQKFDGSRDGAHITGTVQIKSLAYNGDQTPPFPTPATDEGFAKWLEPSLYIESDHAPIVEKSAELCAGATTRWEAVQKIGAWVHQEIAYTIADTPSARLALETRKGDCGPHGTLMVSMLRAAGIPARLVGGVVYAPTFGGSFGQHAWVEVHMGPAGWLAVDPTTGEFNQLSATHIKLFEGMGGAIPTSIKVTTFQPPNLAVTPSDPAQIKPLSWALDTKHTFRFMQGEQKLGEETITISKTEVQGKETYQLKSEIALTGLLQSSADLIVGLDGRPLKYERDLNAGANMVKIKCDFQEGLVKEAISGSTNLARDIKIPAGAFCFDNNFMGCFVVICSQLNLEPDKALTVQTFHPSSLQIIPLTITPKAAAPVTIAGKSVECYECSVAPIKNTFWISKDGKFLRAQQGALVMEVTALD